MWWKQKKIISSSSQMRSKEHIQGAQKQGSQMGSFLSYTFFKEISYFYIFHANLIDTFPEGYFYYICCRKLLRKYSLEKTRIQKSWPFLHLKTVYITVIREIWKVL